MTATIFDTTRTINGAITGGGLIFTSTGTANTFSTRPLSGLTYAEFTVTALTGTPSVGIVGQNWNGSQLGVDASSVGYLSTGAVKYNATTLATLPAYVAGDRIGVAVNHAKRLIWFRKNGGNWNNDALADPATDTGGLSYAAPSPTPGAVISTALFGIQCTLTGTSWTANFSGAFTDAAPAGYVTSDTQQITLARSIAAYEVFIPVADAVVAAARAGMMPRDDRAEKIIAPAGANQHVSGFIREGGVAVAGRKVQAYDRVTGELLGETISAGDGSYSIAALGRTSVRIVANDPATFNSLALDNVVPQ